MKLLNIIGSNDSVLFAGSEHLDYSNDSLCFGSQQQLLTTPHILQPQPVDIQLAKCFRDMMGLNKKSGEKYFEKDPFLVPISNNNTTYVQCYEEKQRLPCPGKFRLCRYSDCQALKLMFWKSD